MVRFLLFRNRFLILAVYSVSPPAKYYLESNNSDLVINGLIDWESARGQVLFHDKWYTYQDIPFHEKLHIIVGKNSPFSKRLS